MPASNYTINLVAFSEGGASKYSPDLTMQTPPDVPSKVPSVSVTVEGQQAAEISESMIITWEPSVESNGRGISSYLVTVCDVQSPQVCLSYRPVTTAVTASGLKPGRNYSVNVEAVNEVGSSGKTSAPKSFYTTYSTPQTPLIPVEGPPLIGLPNTTSIHAVWNAPYSNGLPITSYRLLVDGNEKTLDASQALFPQLISVGLIPGTVHNLSVQAWNAKGPSGLSPTAVFVTASDVPGAPLTLKALVIGQNMKIIFEPAVYSGGEDITSYELFQTSSRAAAEWELVQTLPMPASLSFAVVRERLDLEYSFRVRARNSLGAGAWSTVVFVESDSADLPPSPLNLSYVGGSLRARSVSLEWRMPAGNVTAGIIYYIASLSVVANDYNISSGVDREVELTPASDRECLTSCSGVIDGLVPSVTYDVQMSAVSTAGKSALPSRAVSIQMQSSRPDAIAFLTAATASDTEIDLGWTAPSNNGALLTKYSVRACAGGDCVHHEVPSSSVTYTVTSLSPGVNYTLWISASNELGTSDETAAPGVYTTWSVPIRAYPPFRALPPLDGLDPKTSVHVQWYTPFGNGKPVQSFNLSVDGAYVTVPHGAATPQYVLGGLIPGTEHTFALQALNELGSGMWSDSVVLATANGVPGAPIGAPTVQQQSATQIEATVQPASYAGGLPIDNYEIECTTSVPVTGCNGIVSLVSGVMQYTLSGVQRGLAYTFRSRAVNSLGEGAWSVAYVTSSALNELPPEPRTVNVVTGSESPTAFNLTWVMPDTVHLLASAVTHYSVRLSVNGVQLPSRPLYVSVPLCTSRCEARVLGVDPATTYEVELSAVNTVGSGIYSLPDSVTTPAGVPAAVGMLNATVVSGDAIAVSWVPPRENGAPLLNYTLTACVVGSNVCMPYVVGSSATAFTMVGLAIGTNYTLSISSQNAIGESEVTAMADAYTTWSVPIRAYPPFRALPPLDGLDPKTSVHVQWYTPFGNGKPVQSFSLSMNGSSLVVPYVGEGVPQYAASGLIPGRAYTFAVRAINALGDGGSSPSATFRTDDDVPGGMPQPSVQYAHLTNLSILVHDVAYSGGPAVDHVEVQYCRDALPCKNASIGYHAAFMSFALPTPRIQGAEYRFRSRAWNSLGAGSWSPLLIVSSIAAALVPEPVTGVSFVWSSSRRELLSALRPLLASPRLTRLRPQAPRWEAPGWQLQASVRERAAPARQLHAPARELSASQGCAKVSWDRSPSEELASEADEFRYVVSLQCGAKQPEQKVLDPADVCAGGLPPSRRCSYCANDLVPPGRVQCEASVQAKTKTQSSQPQKAAEKVDQQTGPGQPAPPTITAVSKSTISLTWQPPASFNAAITAYRVWVGTPDGAATTGSPFNLSDVSAVATNVSFEVIGLERGMTYLIRVQARNAFDWSPNSTQVEGHTHARPDRPRDVSYVPDIPHPDKIYALHLQWVFPDDHGDPLTEQQLEFHTSVPGAPDGVSRVSLPPNVTSFVQHGFHPTQRVMVRVRMANSVDWSQWSSDMFMITDPDSITKDLKLSSCFCFGCPLQIQMLVALTHPHADLYLRSLPVGGRAGP